MSDEKTEQPTDKKLEDARKDGEVARSTDFADALSMAGALIALVATVPLFRDGLHELVSIPLSFVAQDRTLERMHADLFRLGATALKLIVPCVFAAALASTAGSVAQAGFRIAAKPVTPNLQTVNPASGIKRIFSAKSLIDCAKMVVKAILLGWVMWQSIKWLFPLVVGSIYQPLGGLSLMFWDMLAKLGAISVGIFLLVGAVDIKLQRFLFIKKMKMSKDEVKREHKEQEGSPELKGERRRLARELASTPPKPRVGLANVLVVNPTHFAVAVRYAPDEHPLPVVIAKGMDADAASLRRAARDAGVPIIGNPPVARALYKVTLNQPIPEELFETVAAILRWVDAIGSPSTPPLH
ncbi:type III secretion system export apparatus subunit SctU [Burkholderia contaminans]|uniref:type III secretion system export apparatus subunit SctU n=1 Tax=Burkholderia contaminans TaxID=488447 RepID=UPI001454B4F6|nr:type III secretion system export apparatus subunit SctU [Burkholderia contaminans]MCA8155132.1 type III secretion system export apparatus subunit SctU [Burkholderia contaminans]VWC83315.1 type III secretion system protein HrcU [Burkholderia contaminans]